MSACDGGIPFVPSLDFALLRCRRRTRKASRNPLSTTIGITIPIAIFSLVVKFEFDILGAWLVFAAELFEFESGADESDCTVNEALGEYDATDTLDATVGDVLDADGIVELVRGSKPLTEAPFLHVVKPRKLMN